MIERAHAIATDVDTTVSIGISCRGVRSRARGRVDHGDGTAAEVIDRRFRGVAADHNLVKDRDGSTRLVDCATHVGGRRTGVTEGDLAHANRGAGINIQNRATDAIRDAEGAADRIDRVEEVDGATVQGEARASRFDHDVGLGQVRGRISHGLDQLACSEGVAVRTVEPERGAAANIAVQGDLASAEGTRGTRGAAADAVISRHAADPNIGVAIAAVRGVSTTVNPEVAEGVIAQEANRRIRRALATEDENVGGVGRADDPPEDTRAVVRVDLGITVDTHIARNGRTFETDSAEADGGTKSEDGRRGAAVINGVCVAQASEDEVISEGRVLKVSLAAILNDDGRTTELRRNARHETHGAVRSESARGLEEQRAREADIIASQGGFTRARRTRDIIVDAHRAGAGQRGGQGDVAVGIRHEQRGRRGNRDGRSSGDDRAATPELEGARGNRGGTREGISTREREDTVTDLGEGQLARSPIGEDARED